MSDTVKSIFYLVLKKRNHWSLSARLSKNQPRLASDERAMKLDISVPRALFSTPTLQATVTIPESCVSKPSIDATVMDNVRELIQQTTGLDVKVALVETETA
jgi:hypothetical protein